MDAIGLPIQRAKGLKSVVWFMDMHVTPNFKDATIRITRITEKGWMDIGHGVPESSPTLMSANESGGS